MLSRWRGRHDDQPGTDLERCALGLSGCHRGLLQSRTDLPAETTSPGRQRAFVGIGSSTSGRGARDEDEMAEISGVTDRAHR